MRILLTGASGYIGKHLLGMLAERSVTVDHDIVLLTAHAIPGWSCVVVDRDADGNYLLDDAAAVALRRAKFDCVMHLGAFTPKSGAEANRIGPSTSSIVNLRTLIDAIDHPSRFILASSIDVYGSSKSPLREETMPNPTSLYGAAKLYSERLLQAWAQEYDVGLSILRIGHIYGPGEEAYRKFIPASIERIKAGRAPLITSSGDERRSFFYINDLCDFMVRVMVEEQSLGIVNVASATVHTISEVAAMLVGIAREQGISVADPEIEGRVKGADVVVDAGRMRTIHPRPETSMEVGLRTEFKAAIDTQR